ncbi:MAG: hypothetical protein NTV80_20935 [Verrucomicrobia bacterium]|nr:hypothetical protein [Verrucomicrobiota bacterium]
MTLSNRIHLLFWCFVFTQGSGLAQELPDWQSAALRLEANQAARLLNTQQLLINELGILHHLAIKSGDIPQSNVLATEVALAEADLNLLKKGRVPSFAGVQAEKVDWLRAATGKTWALVNTTNVKRLGIRAGLLQLIDEKTGSIIGASIASTHHSPGFFYQITSTRPFIACFFSPDLKSLHYMTATGLPSSINMVGQALSLPPANEKQPIEADPTADLTSLLRGKFKKGVCQYLDALIPQLAEAATKDEKAGLALEKAKMERAALFQTRPTFENRPGRVPTNFLALAEGRTWRFGNSKTLSSISYANKVFRITNPEGQVFVYQNPTVLWPGFLTITHPNKTRYALWFEGETIDKLRVTSIVGQWSGHLIE